jgi:inorganic phosphate transporter, PiT family
MLDIPIILLIIIIITLAFDFTNGAHDSANAIATVVSTKVLSPVAAVIMAGSLNLVGAFIGTKVAETIGSGMIHTQMIMDCKVLILAALLGAISWNVFTWYLGLPSSSSHAIIGGLIGAAIAYKGWSSLNFESILEKVIFPLFLSPVGGFLGGYLLMVVLAWMVHKANPKKMNNLFKKLQIISSAFMALSHGTNDAQKSMGIITLALFTFNIIPVIAVPLWVKIACAFAIMLGTVTGGWKIIKTMGHKIFKLEPIHGFASATSTTIVVLAASAFGAPISTTQVISSSILGVGSSKRFSAVRWGVAGNMVIAWFVTIPATAVVSAICLYILNAIY